MRGSWTNVSAALELAERKKDFESSKKEEKQTKDQFLLAATQRPLRFRSRLQKLQYEGATARKDAEEDEWSRWLHVLAGIVSSHGEASAGQARGVKLLGAGKRASTLRSRIRAVRKYVVWLSGAFAIAFPARPNAGNRVPPDASRGAVRQRSNQRGAPSHGFPSKRCQGYQTRNAALRHRSISLRKSRSSQQLCRVRTTEGSRPQTSNWTAKDSRQKLRHAKSIGFDRGLNMRLVVVDVACFVQDKRWMEIGWQLVRQEAPFERDYLLLSPSGNYRVCLRRKLKYSVGAAVQAKILASLQFRQQQLFDHPVAHFWTPHSGREL